MAIRAVSESGTKKTLLSDRSSLLGILTLPSCPLTRRPLRNERATRLTARETAVSGTEGGGWQKRLTTALIALPTRVF
jgi:hypothetical protein